MEAGRNKIKKILVFSHNCFSQSSNNGKTLYNIFSSFSTEELAQLYLNDDEKPDYSICHNYFQITDKEILLSIFKFKSNVGKKIVEKESNNTNDLKNNKLKFKPSKINDWKTLGRNYLWKASKWNSKNLQQWLTEQAPKCIFFVGGNYTFSHYMAVELSDSLGIPLITYLTDDYIIYPLYKGIIQKIYKFQLINSFRKTIDQSKLCFVIGDLMSKEYSLYFKKKIFPIMNCVDFKEKNLPSLTSRSITISYFGGLHLKRWKSLFLFSEFIRSIEQETSAEIVINVYTFSNLSTKIRRCFKKNNINLKTPIKGENYEKALLESTFLLHVESDDPIIRNYTKLSISTKIPEYLISSRPIIGFGPIDVASMRLISENRIGVVIDAENMHVEEQKEKMVELIRHPGLRIKLIEEGYEYANNNFLKTEVSTKFKKKIYNLLNHDLI